MSVDALERDLRHSLRGRVESHRPLARLTTYRLGGPARLYVEPVDLHDVEALGRALARAPEADVLVLGRGSNLVVSDRGWPGVVVRLGAGFARVEPLDIDDPAAHLSGLRAGGGAPLPTLANWAARRGLQGLEFLVSIPGSVGGAVRMNAGAHGSDIARTLRSVRLLDLRAGAIGSRAASALELGYRRSRLGGRDLVLDAAFELSRGDPRAIQGRMDGFRRRRAATQPGALQNAGSVFKNPPGDFAGRLVEAAGLKGFRVGGASVCELHANFFIASDDATAQDVYDLVHSVRARVRAAFGVDLEPEVRFAGVFRDGRGARVAEVAS